MPHSKQFCDSTLKAEVSDASPVNPGLPIATKFPSRGGCLKHSLYYKLAVNLVSNCLYPRVFAHLFVNNRAITLHYIYVFTKRINIFQIYKNANRTTWDTHGQLRDAEQDSTQEPEPSFWAPAVPSEPPTRGVATHLR